MEHTFLIFKNGEEINSIFSDESFCKSYCDKNGYTFQKIEDADIESARAAKESELSSACNATIVSGVDVQTTKGMEHFALQETDQINLTTAYNAILSGATAYPYHADGQLCRMFTADEIKAVSNASIAHKLYHTTLCNHLLTWARRAETQEEVESITYTAEGLPDDLAANMAQVLAASQNV
ncbi:DUF4376 domain-containing protein [Dysosmobacter sp.]|uniref:DUF4376 domain-containing protein n=1 Tax=Dysosmobacter sp. TaxID=2591382 RepID=UPI003FD773E3